MDIVTYALCKKLASSAVSGVADMTVNGTTLIIHTNDGQTLEMDFPTPADGVSITNIEIDENNNLICHMSDGSKVNAGPIPVGKTPIKGVDYFTEEDINEIVSRIETEELETATEEDIDKLFENSAYEDMYATTEDIDLLFE